MVPSHKKGARHCFISTAFQCPKIYLPIDGRIDTKATRRAVTVKRNVKNSAECKKHNTKVRHHLPFYGH